MAEPTNGRTDEKVLYPQHKKYAAGYKAEKVEKVVISDFLLTIYSFLFVPKQVCHRNIIPIQVGHRNIKTELGLS